MTDTAQLRTCRFCSDEVAVVRFVTVQIGKRQTRREAVLPIDVEPHSDGTVIELGDGRFKLLTRTKNPDPFVPRYRLHGASNCGPKARRRDDR